MENWVIKEALNGVPFNYGVKLHGMAGLIHGT